MTLNSNKIGNQGDRTSEAQVNFVRLLHSQKFSVDQILAKLLERFGSTARRRRWVYGVIKDMDTNVTPWQRQLTNGEDCALIADAMAEVTKVSGGKKIEPTQEEFEWLVWICKRVPTLPPMYQWAMATLYRTESLQKDPDFSQFEPFLNMKPWESLQALKDYDDMAEQGAINQGMFMAGIASGAREEVYEAKQKDDLADLKRLAHEGDPTAIFLMTTYEDAVGDESSNLYGDVQDAKAWRAQLDELTVEDFWPKDLDDENDARRDAHG